MRLDKTFTVQYKILENNNKKEPIPHYMHDMFFLYLSDIYWAEGMTPLTWEASKSPQL